MTDFQHIEIDFEVHKKIEQERTGFDESANTVLRRLLGIANSSPVASHTAIRAWSGKGVTLPHGTKVKMDYNGRTHSGMIKNGQWVVEGFIGSNPSPAASAVGLTKSGRRTQLDGWKYWFVQLPEEDRWVSLSSLRPVPVEVQKIGEGIL